MNIKKYWGVILIIGFSLWAIFPLFHGGSFPVHDKAQESRIYAMSRSLQDGMFPVRWVNGFGYGYGYPLFNFYAPLVYYLGGFISLISQIDLLVLTKLLLVVGFIFSGITMYLLAKNFWGELGGVISGLLYMYAPFHAIDLYVRGDLAEFFAYGFIPLIFLGFYKIYTTKKNTYISGTIASLSLAGIIITHNLTALIVTPFLLIAIAVMSILSYIKTKKYKVVCQMLFYLFLALVMPAFYWLPVFSEMKYTNVISQTGGGFDFHDHFVCLNQLWSSPWGYGGSTRGCVDGLSFMIGKVHVFFSLLALAASLFFYRKSKNYWLIILTSILLLASTLLTTNITQFFWDTIPLMKFVQFPWRYLILAAFFSSFISGFVFLVLEKMFFKSKQIIFVILTLFFCAFFIFFTGKYFRPQLYEVVNPAYFSDYSTMAWILSNDSHEYLPKNFTIPYNKEQIPQSIFNLEKGNASIIYQSNITQEKTAVIMSKSLSLIHANIAYFPAWNLYVNNQLRSYNIGPDGINFAVNPGKYKIELKFQETPIERFSDLISLIGIVILTIGIILRIIPHGNKT